MQDFFTDRKQNCEVVGKSNEYLVFKRRGNSTTRFTENNIYEVLLQDNTSITNGDVIINESGVYHFVVSRRDGYLSKIAQLQKTNTQVDIYRLKKHYTNGNYDYDLGIPLELSVASYYEDITGKMQQYDPGLKSTSTRRFLLLIPDLKKLDIIKFNNEYMQVDDINTSSYPGLLWIQCSPYNKVIRFE